MPREVTAFSNATVKRLRSLRDKKARKAEGLFLAEGLRIITEARDSGRLPEIVMFSPEGARHPLAAEIIAATEAAGGDAIETTPDILSKTSGKDNPQMLVAAYRQPETAPRCAGSVRGAALVRRPGAARSRQYRNDPADGRRRWRGRPDPDRRQRRPLFGRGRPCFHGRHLHAAGREGLVGRVRRLAPRSGPGQLVGTSLKADRDYLDVDYQTPASCSSAMSSRDFLQAYEDECDVLVKIPMAGRADSLNAAIAAAVMAFQVRASWRGS